MRKLLSFFLCLCLTVACSRRPDPALIRASEMASDSPRVALAILDSVDYARLGAADRHFHDFLTVKARDKAYITHTSDSLILDVISYYEGKPLYAEALYYGGRVYSDMGDFPTALEYFQRGLDEIETKDAESLRIKGNLLSQTGRLLNELALYSQAIPYLKEVLAVDSIEKDTFNLAYDHMLLGAIYLHQKNYEDAERQFDNAMASAKSLAPANMGEVRIYQAGVRRELGDIDSALTLIRGVPDMVEPIARNQALIYASDIYLAAGIKDTAYLYADEIIHSKNPNNRKNGYRNLLSAGLSDMVPDDSLRPYVIGYSRNLHAYYSSHEAQQALIQNSYYNYRIHQRERAKAEASSHIYLLSAFLLTVAALVLCIVGFWIKHRKNKEIISLQKAILNLESLCGGVSDGSVETQTSKSVPQSDDVETLKNRLIHQAGLLKGQDAERQPGQAEIRRSEVYHELKRHVMEGNPVPEDSPVWALLENVIIENNPLFKERLGMLTDNKLKAHDYRMVLLIKCGFTPTQMTTLLSRTKSTISYRRKHICEMIFGKNMNSALIDSTIRSI